MTFKMITSDRRKIYACDAAGSKRRKDETPVQNEKMIVYGPEPFLNDGLVDKLTVSSRFRRFVVFPFCDRDRRTGKFQL